MLFESRILLAFIEAHYNFVTLTTQEENPLDAAIAARIVSPSASTLTKGSWVPGTRLVPSTPQVSQNTLRKKETTTTAPLSTGESSWVIWGELKDLWGFQEKPSKHLTVFSSETVNIKKLANLTANTKNYGQITLNPIQTLWTYDSVRFGIRLLLNSK